MGGVGGGGGGGGGVCWIEMVAVCLCVVYVVCVGMWGAVSRSLSLREHEKKTSSINRTAKKKEEYNLKKLHALFGQHLLLGELGVEEVERVLQVLRQHRPLQVHRRLVLG